MGNNCSNNVDPISAAIDRELLQEKRSISHVNNSRLLLLGAGESGKSTFAKQLSKIYGYEFTKEEIQTFKLVVYENVLYSVKGLITAAKAHNINFQEENKPKLDELLNVDFNNFTARIGIMVRDVIRDPAITEAFKLYSTFHLLDSAKYYFDNIDRIISDDYIPSEEDIIRSRKKTSGVQENRIVLSEQEVITVIDVGGQRSERRKWAMCFNDITCLIFFVSLSEYDLVLYEDKQTNRMLESLQLFKDICNFPYFTNVPFIIFLNKYDLFLEKMRLGKNISSAFPDYQGKCDPEESIEFIKGKFTEQNTNLSRKLNFYETTAIDREKLIKIWDNVSYLALSKAMQKDLNWSL